MNTENNLTPEDEHDYLSWQKSHRRGKVMAGILVVAFGIIYLINETGNPMPKWIFSLPMFLMALGLIVLVKHKFKKLGGWVLVIVGKVLLLNEFYPNMMNYDIIWPILIILLGIKLIFKPKRSDHNNRWRRIKRHHHRHHNRHNDHLCNPVAFQNLDEISDNDFIDSVSFFGGITKNVVSKNFKGADIVNVFGGAEINLLQAEIETQAIVELTCVFGGVTLIIPANWQLKSELTTAFGGIEDKRQMNVNYDGDSKVVILRGNCVFGGIEIKNFK